MQIEAGLGVGVKDSPNALGSSDWDCALLRDNLVAVRHLHDASGARLDELQVSSATLPHPVGLCRGVDLRRVAKSHMYQFWFPFFLFLMLLNASEALKKDFVGGCGEVVGWNSRR